jgi:hypothetical protein
VNLLQHDKEVPPTKDQLHVKTYSFEFLAQSSFSFRKDHDQGELKEADSLLAVCSDKKETSKRKQILIASR